MRLSPTLRWVLLAILGLAIAITVAIAASKLTSQRIGLASEPLPSAGELAPASASGDRGRKTQDHHGSGGHHGGGSPTTTSTVAPTPTTTATVSPTTTAAPDSSGESETGSEGSGDD